MCAELRSFQNYDMGHGATQIWSLAYNFHLNRLVINQTDLFSWFQIYFLLCAKSIIDQIDLFSGFKYLFLVTLRKLSTYILQVNMRNNLMKA